jgi:arylsulfatase A-like enzyme
VSSIDEMGLTDNTLVLYIVGDNGASSEGLLEGSLNLEGAMNGVTQTAEEILPHIDDLGTWKAYNHFPVGLAIALDTPFQWTK